MKKLLVLLLVLGAVALGTTVWLSRHLDSLVQQAIEDYAGPMTQAKVSVGAVKISPVDGKGSILQLTLGNPEGFKTAHALKVAQVDVELDIASLAQDVILIRRIAIVAPDVIYERGDQLSNFDALSQHIARSLGHEKGTNKGAKKLIVELLTVRDAKVQASAAFLNGSTVTLPLPDITLRDIGRARGGATPGELGQEIAAALKSRLNAAAHLERLLQPTTDSMGQWGAAVKGLFK